MTSSNRLALSLLLGLVTTLPARPGAAQPVPPTAQELETARSLYKQGKELRASGDLPGALEKLQAAHALGNTPVTGIELARTYVLVGRIVEAREVCLYIARMPVASDETGKSVEARAEAAKLAEDLKPRIPTLVVRIAGLAAGESAHVSIDGAAIPDAAMSEPQKVNPGKHTVVVRAGEGRREIQGTLEVAEGQAAEIALTPPELPPQAATPTATPTATSTPTPTSTPPAPFASLAKVSFSMAAIAGAVGVVSGLVALNKRGQLDQLCNSQRQCDGPHGGSADLASAYSWATASTISFAVAVPWVATGIVGLVSRSPAPAAEGEGALLTPWIGPGAAGIHGRF